MIKKKLRVLGHLEKIHKSQDYQSLVNEGIIVDDLQHTITYLKESIREEELTPSQRFYQRMEQEFPGIVEVSGGVGKLSKNNFYLNFYFGYIPVPAFLLLNVVRDFNLGDYIGHYLTIDEIPRANNQRPVYIDNFAFIPDLKQRLVGASISVRVTEEDWQEKVEELITGLRAVKEIFEDADLDEFRDVRERMREALIVN